MNNIKEHDEAFTNIEPQISYYSTTFNRGVTAIFPKKEKKVYKKINELYIPFSPKNNFSLCNTVMIPFIINENLLENENNITTTNTNFNKTFSISKDKDTNHISQTRNLTENDINETLNDKSKINKEYLNTENNTFLLAKNLSTNYKIVNKNEESNEKCTDELDGDKKRYSKIEGEFKDYMSKEQCKSVNINDISMKKSILKYASKDNKKRIKKAKIKECFLDKKIKKKIQNDKRKSFFSCNKQPNGLLGETNKNLNIKRVELNRKSTDKPIMDKKSKNYYYSHKLINKNYNENYFKIIIKQNNINKIDEKGNLKKFKSDNKKSKKIGNKTPFRETNMNSKVLKQKFAKVIKNYNEKIIRKKRISQSNQGLCIIKNHLKNKDKKEDSSNDSFNNNDNNKKGKKKIVRVRSKKERNILKNQNISINAKEKMESRSKTPNEGESEFSFRKKMKKRASDIDINEQLTFKAIKKNSKEKEKDNILKSKQQSIKDSTAKKKLNNYLSKKEMCNLKFFTEEKKNTNNINQTPLLRRKRSISMNFGKTRIKEIADQLKRKKKSVDDKNLSSKNVEKAKKKNLKNIDFESALKNNSKKMQFNLFSKDKFTNTEFSDSDYLKYTLNCMELMLEIDMSKQVRLKNKVNFNFPKPKKNGIKKKIALFDLDETLVHCTGNIKEKKEYQHAIEIKLPGKQAVIVGINIRPYWKQTLNLIKRHYHIVVYTASHQAYADSVLDFMDPKKKYFKYRLYRNNCSLIDVEGSKFYVKDLDILNEHYDLKDVVIVDNSVLSFSYHLHNGIPIVPYYDEDKDGSLYVVGLYLMHIFPEADLREANKKQINLDSFLEAAKREKNEEIIKEEIDGEEDENLENMNQSENNKEGEGDMNKDDQDYKKISDKILKLNIRRKTMLFPIYKRRQSHDFTQKKLISQSKLINMYYEINNNDSCKTMQQNPSDFSDEENNKSETNADNIDNVDNVDNVDIVDNVDNVDNIDNANNKKEGEENKDNDIKEGEILCKSEPNNYPSFRKNNNNNTNSDNESASGDEQVAVLKRGFTIYQDKSNNGDDKNANLKGKLNFIRSNFYNKFKI
jgi:CTD small phosphatase-like protein 2